ncbi:MAG TPA: dipeptide epimerase [Candidatus Bathyarchaeia archaeon]|nr:dipeptide epimerase [Candidatus Bathyarchaeia archaeon]
MMPNKKNSILNVTVCDLKAPLIYPFRIASGKHDALENVLICLECADGIKGFGEAAVATHITGETVAQTRANLKRFAKGLIGKDLSDYAALSARASSQFQKNKSALAAVEMALLDAYTRSRGVPLWTFFGKKLNRVVTDITLVIADLPQTKNAAGKFYRQGFRTFKIKIGRDFDGDIKRVAAVKKIAPRVKIILDANQAFSADEALDFLNELKKLKVHPMLIEQPVAKADWEGLEKITRESRVKVCADESVGSLKDAAFAIKHKAVNVINIKFMKSGILEGQQIARLAVKHRIELMMGSMMESPLSALAAAHFAGGSGLFKDIDLDTPFFVRGNAFEQAHLSPSGVYQLKKVKQGIGMIPDVKED